MNPPSFHAPTLETLSGLLPAFEFVALVASNDYGAVYMARQRSLDRDVAIKLLSPAVSGKPEFRQLFEATARTMARLNHPNLISVFDSGFVEGMLYFVMEFVPGKSLEHSARGQQIEFTQAVRLIGEISDGLAHAHAHGIVHGDLHPADILLNQKAEPKIGNFGFSHPSQSAAEGGGVTPFTAPELIGRPEAADTRSDIYSAGALLYQLVTGRAHQPDAPPPSSLANCGAALDAVWKQATDPDPARRYPDMGAFRKAVTELLKGPRAVGGKTPPITQRLATPPISQRLATGSAPKPVTSDAAAPVRPVPAKHHVGLNWKLFRNLIIIAGLLYAINIAWQWNKDARIRHAAEKERQIAEQQARKERDLAEARKRAEQRSNGTGSSQTGPDAIVPPVPPPIQETPARSLLRLREALASGDRSEMPAGTERKGDFDYFLVEEPMTWPEAAWFAEQHGGHLSIPNASADLTWLVRNVAKDRGIWIGAARNGRQSWALADGLIWSPKKEPTGLGTYLSVDKFGLLKTGGASERLPFVIQWHRDGGNPASLQAVLAKSRGTLSHASPVFPPGTVTIDNRHYLYVARPATWREAVEIAGKSGGHLAVAAETAEIARLAALAEEIPATDGIWLGAFCKAGQWAWITGESWKSPKWATSPGPEAANYVLALMPKMGWEARNPTQQGSGFIIEWSGDHKGSVSADPGAGSSGGPTAELATLGSKARDLIAAADLKRTELLTANARRFQWDLDIIVRGLTKSDQVIWVPHVNRLKSLITNQRVPASIPEASGIKLNPKMAELARSCADKQQRADADFQTEAERIRTAYVAKVRESMAKASQSGQDSLVQAHQEILDSASNLGVWVRSLGVELLPENPVPVKAGRPESTDSKSPAEEKPRGGSLFE